MGQELRCTATYAGQVGEGKAHLETDEVVFRGDFRLRVPFRDIQDVEAADGQLRLRLAAGEAVFALGPQAEKWAAKIRNPPSLLDKLGVKPGLRVSLVGFESSGDTLQAEIASRTADIHSGEAAPESDLVFYRVDALGELDRLPALKERIRRNGAIWVISPKGLKHFTDRDVMAAGLRAGLVDVKVARYSATHTAAKFVIPVRQRSLSPNTGYLGLSAAGAPPGRERPGYVYKGR